MPIGDRLPFRQSDCSLISMHYFFGENKGFGRVLRKRFLKFVLKIVEAVLVD